MITTRMRDNANKFAYLVRAYPEKTVPEIIGLFQMSAIDLNCAIWAAVELGYIREMDPKTNFSEPLEIPKKWEFGEEIENLESSLLYAFIKLNAEEKDMEENYLSNWTNGYTSQDTLIAVKHLLEENILHEYEIEDGENAYIFYTLKKNAGHNWGQKQFKTNPLTGMKNTRKNKKK